MSPLCVSFGARYEQPQYNHRSSAMDWFVGRIRPGKALLEVSRLLSDTLTQLGLRSTGEVPPGSRPLQPADRDPAALPKATRKI